MKENGYYYFSPDNIIIQADSTLGNSKVAINVKLKDQTPELSKKFSIDKVIIYPDYSIQNVEKGNITIPTTTEGLEIYRDMYIIDPEKNLNRKFLIGLCTFTQVKFITEKTIILRLKDL